MKDYEELYEVFWKNIVEEGGVVNLEQIKKELFDFHTLIVNIPKIFDHITGGACTKPLTNASVVCNLADEHYAELYSEEDE